MSVETKSVEEILMNIQPWYAEPSVNVRTEKSRASVFMAVTADDASLQILADRTSGEAAKIQEYASYAEAIEAGERFTVGLYVTADGSISASIGFGECADEIPLNDYEKGTAYFRTDTFCKCAFGRNLSDVLMDLESGHSEIADLLNHRLDILTSVMRHFAESDNTTALEEFLSTSLGIEVGNLKEDDWTTRSLLDELPTLYILKFAEKQGIEIKPFQFEAKKSPKDNMERD